jgi:[protein-PII] uridylyltransferase
MDTLTPDIPLAPYFDPLALRIELTALFHAAGSEPERARPAVIARLKELLKLARLTARARLESDTNGRRCASDLSHFQDELIRLIYDYKSTHVWRATNPSDAERMAVVATGGYGRALLAPGSDIDLLFLLPYKQTAWGESVAESILHVLWDLGFKVGHATRTIDQCIKYAQSDVTICTSLLDARLIHGDQRLFDALQQRFASDVVKGTSRAFVDAKMEERRKRHAASGTSRYRVEPNVKDGKGGLRDLHTLHWLSKYAYGDDVGPKAVAAGLYTAEEVQTFRRCEDFLWSVRCFLHFLTGRAEERLTFELQPQMAALLGYSERGGQRAVERCMKHYFLVAKDVGTLTTILCSALEMRQMKAAPRLSGVIGQLGWMARREIRKKTDFRVDNDRINIADPEAFTRDPVNIIRFFAQAEHGGAALHPDAIRQLRQSLRLIDAKLRCDPEANRIFLDLLTGKVNPEGTLRQMNEAGVLERFIPQFRRVVAMMQFNMYHHFTVDEHLIRTVGMLNDIEKGVSKSELPLSAVLMPQIQNRVVLYVAAFLHDIGKGRTEDHSIVGARIARQLCPRLGLTEAETETVAWLIEQHLTMSNIAQSRDLSDPKTIRDFADIVQSPERLKMLLLLTIADIRAVGPGVWNGWKGQLLRTLYYETEPLVAGGHTLIERGQRLEAAKADLRGKLSDWPAAEVDRFIGRHFPDYWLRTETDEQITHAAIIKSAEETGKSLVIAAKTDAFKSITELTIYAPNHARLLSMFAGACAAAGANISGAHITTTRDGFALDTFQLARDFATDEDELRRTKRIGQAIDSVLSGSARLNSLINKRRLTSQRADAFKVAPEVIINNQLSDRYTVIEVAGRDRTGLLYDLTSTLSDLNLDIMSAHITTFGEKAVDVFYVTDLTGKKVESGDRHKAIRARLETILANAAGSA